MDRRTGAVLLACALVTGCGPSLGLERRGPEPSGPWTTAGGEEVPRQQVESAAGAEHCDWQEAHFLAVSWPPGRTYDDPRRQRTFVRDPEGVLPVPALREGFQARTSLPDDAVDTGYRNGLHALWWSPSADDSRVWLVKGGEDVESWPLAAEPVGCA